MESNEELVNRNRLIAGAAILTALVVLVIFGLIRSKSRQPQANQRSPVSQLAYCSSNAVRPCIVSFSLDSDGNMLVNILTPGASFPDFYLKITRIESSDESIYECQKVKGFSTSVYCIGEKMSIGEDLQFMIISRKDDSLLAEGRFAIIGLALPTPEFAISTSGTEPGASPTQGIFPVTPTPVQATPSPSYPNPGYPNPSYPKPSYP